MGKYLRVKQYDTCKGHLFAHVLLPLAMFEMSRSANTLNGMVQLLGALARLL